MSRLRIIITGSQGFVGKRLAEVITANAAKDVDLIEFLDPETGTRPDIKDRPAIDRAIASAQPDCLIHLAAIAAPREAQKNPAEAWSVNVMGTFHLAQALLTHAPHARMIWSGSSEAYGQSFNSQSLPIRENVPLDPLTSYGATKAAADIMLRQMSRSGLDAVVFRPFNHTGPGQSTDYVVPAFASQIAQIEAGLKPPVIYVGNLSACRDFLDVSDVVDAYLGAARSPRSLAGGCYNISTGEPVRVETILEILLQAARIDISVQVDPARYVENPVPIASGDNSALRDAINWRPKTPLEQTLLAVLDEHRKLLQTQSP